VDNLLWFIGLGLLAGLSMFSVVFRRVRAELTASRARGVPVAVIASHRGHPRGGEGGGLRALLAHGMPTLQAAIVATAATSILVMTLCLIACVVLAVLAR
jgi:hypothetical protein